jgi:hypothetical protein
VLDCGNFWDKGGSGSVEAVDLCVSMCWYLSILGCYGFSWRGLTEQGRGVQMVAGYILYIEEAGRYGGSSGGRGWLNVERKFHENFLAPSNRFNGRRGCRKDLRQGIGHI